MSRKKTGRLSKSTNVPATDLEKREPIPANDYPIIVFLCGFSIVVLGIIVALIITFAREAPGLFCCVVLLILGIVLWVWKVAFLFDYYFTAPYRAPRSNLSHYEFVYARCRGPYRNGGWIRNASMYKNRSHLSGGREPLWAVPEDTEKVGYVLPGKELREPVHGIWTHVEVDTETEEGWELWVLHALVDRNDKAMLKKMWQSRDRHEGIAPPFEMKLAQEARV